MRAVFGDRSGQYRSALVDVVISRRPNRKLYGLACLEGRGRRCRELLQSVSPRRWPRQQYYISLDGWLSIIWAGVHLIIEIPSGELRSADAETPGRPQRTWESDWEGSP